MERKILKIVYPRPKNIDEMIAKLDETQGKIRKYCERVCGERYHRDFNLYTTSCDCELVEAVRWCYLTMYGLVDLKKKLEANQKGVKHA